MPIRIEHGKVEDVAALGKAAGAAEATAVKEAQELDLAKFTAGVNSQERLQVQRIEHDIKIRQFQEDASYEKAKQLMVWELQETDQRQQFDLEQDLFRQKIRDDSIFSQEMKREERETSERNRKLEAIRIAEENNQLSPREANELRTKINVGSFPVKRTAQGGMDELLAQLLGEDEIAQPLGTTVIGADDIPDRPRSAQQDPFAISGITSGVAKIGGGLKEQLAIDEARKAEKLEKKLAKSDKPFVKTGILGLRKKVPNIPVIKEIVQQAQDVGIMDAEDTAALIEAMQENDVATLTKMIKAIQKALK